MGNFFYQLTFRDLTKDDASSWRALQDDKKIVTVRVLLRTVRPRRSDVLEHV